MADFRNSRKFETARPAIKVDPGLPEGRYLFQLTVVDDQGNRSRPAKLRLEIIRGRVLIDARLVDPVGAGPITRDARIRPD